MWPVCDWAANGGQLRWFHAQVFFRSTVWPRHIHRVWGSHFHVGKPLSNTIFIINNYNSPAHLTNVNACGCTKLYYLNGDTPIKKWQRLPERPHRASSGRISLCHIWLIHFWITIHLKVRVMLNVEGQIGAFERFFWLIVCRYARLWKSSEAFSNLPSHF